MTKDNYNKIPVFYCNKCRSLKIMRIPKSTSGTFCAICGSSYYIKKGNINTLIENGTIKAISPSGDR
jgi:hypothetical protein